MCEDLKKLKTVPDKLDNISKSIHEIQISLATLTTHITSELGGPDSPGNIHRQLNKMDNSVKEINELLRGEDGHGYRIRALEKKDETISEGLKDISDWKQEMKEVATPTQLKEIKTEVAKQKTNWVVATTLFAVVQAAVLAALKFLK